MTNHPHDNPDRDADYEILADAQHRHLNQFELADRWRMSARTLERWRWRKRGPRYIKVGGRVLYRVVDIEDFERENEHVAGDAPDEDD